MSSSGEILAENEHFFVRRVRSVVEMSFVSEVAETYDFAYGIHNLKVYYNICPDHIFLLIHKSTEKVVGFWIDNDVLDGIHYVHGIMILEECQRLGGFGLMESVSERFRRPGTVVVQNRNYRILPKANPGTVFMYKQTGYDGKPDLNYLPLPDSVTANANFVVCTAGLADMEALLKYDRSLYSKYPSEKRDQFIKTWSFPSEGDAVARTCIAKSRTSGDIVGFGVLRLTEGEEWRLCPVYADSTDIGKALVISLLFLTNGSPVYLSFPAHHRSLIEICKMAKLTWNYAECRMYEGGRTLDFPFEKLFAEHEFWPI